MSRVIMPTLPCAEPLPEVVLFGCDRWAFPFSSNVQLHLVSARNPKLVLAHGPDGAHDEVLLYYGTTLRIGDTLHMWYNGNHGPLHNEVGYERQQCVICLATSHDGEHWEKPDLGLVEFNGSQHNNIVDFRDPALWASCALLHEPDEPDEQRRFKMVYEVKGEGGNPFSVAFSPDGLHWTHSPRNPVGPPLEMAGICKHGGLYYVNGQGRGYGPVRARRLVTYVSRDFEVWSPCPALGLDRAPSLYGPASEDAWNQDEEIHLGAALWNRGNVLLGVYGQWHGVPSGDRRLVTMDLGLALTHDALHFYEPIPGFKFVPAREQPDPPTGFGPALMQGQGMENVGERTLYWYSLWRSTPGSGVRLVSWPRDRLGMLKPFRPTDATAISAPLQALDGPARIFVNASGLGHYSQMRVSLLDEGFAPIPGYSGSDAAVVARDGFRTPLAWHGGGDIAPDMGRVRIEVRFVGVRPEDTNLHAVYVSA